MLRINPMIDNTANGANTAMMMNAGVYDVCVIFGINQFITMTETAPILPANPAKVPTDGPRNKSLEIV